MMKQEANLDSEKQRFHIVKNNTSKYQSTLINTC